MTGTLGEVRDMAVLARGAHAAAQRAAAPYHAAAAAAAACAQRQRNAAAAVEAIDDVLDLAAALQDLKAAASALDDAGCAAALRHVHAMQQRVPLSEDEHAFVRKCESSVRARLEAQLDAGIAANDAGQISQACQLLSMAGAAAVGSQKFAAVAVLQCMDALRTWLPLSNDVVAGLIYAVESRGGLQVSEWDVLVAAAAASVHAAVLQWLGTDSVPADLANDQGHIQWRAFLAKVFGTGARAAAEAVQLVAPDPAASSTAWAGSVCAAARAVQASADGQLQLSVPPEQRLDAGAFHIVACIAHVVGVIAAGVTRAAAGSPALMACRAFAIMEQGAPLADAARSVQQALALPSEVAPGAAEPLAACAERGREWAAAMDRALERRATSVRAMLAVDGELWGHADSTRPYEERDVLTTSHAPQAMDTAATLCAMLLQQYESFVRALSAVLLPHEQAHVAACDELADLITLVCAGPGAARSPKQRAVQDGLAAAAAAAGCDDATAAALHAALDGSQPVRCSAPVSLARRAELANLPAWHGSVGLLTATYVQLEQSNFLRGLQLSASGCSLVSLVPATLSLADDVGAIVQRAVSRAIATGSAAVFAATAAALSEWIVGTEPAHGAAHVHVSLNADDPSNMRARVHISDEPVQHQQLQPLAGLLRTWLPAVRHAAARPFEAPSQAAADCAVPAVAALAAVQAVVSKAKLRAGPPATPPRSAARAACMQDVLSSPGKLQAIAASADAATVREVAASAAAAFAGSVDQVSALAKGVPGAQAAMDDPLLGLSHTPVAAAAVLNTIADCVHSLHDVLAVAQRECEAVFGGAEPAVQVGLDALRRMEQALRDMLTSAVSTAFSAFTPRLRGVLALLEGDAAVLQYGELGGSATASNELLQAELLRPLDSMVRPVQALWADGAFQLWAAKLLAFVCSAMERSIKRRRCSEQGAFAFDRDVRALTAWAGTYGLEPGMLCLARLAAYADVLTSRPGAAPASMPATSGVLTPADIQAVLTTR